jgi:hypothetical protein
MFRTLKQHDVYRYNTQRLRCMPNHLPLFRTCVPNRPIKPPSLQILFAMSPLLVLGYVLITGFDDDDSETAKRSKKTDFQLDGHDE